MTHSVDPLITAMDRFDGKPSGSVRDTLSGWMPAVVGPSPLQGGIRENVYALIQDTASKATGSWFSSKDAPVIQYQRASNWHFFSPTVYNFDFSGWGASSAPTSRSSQRSDEADKGATRAVVFALIAVGAFAGTFFLSRSVGQWWDMRQLDTELEDIEQKIQGDVPNNPLEAKECRDSLLHELSASRKAVQIASRKAKGIILAEALFLTGLGALAYYRLYQRAFAAYALMEASWLGSAVTLAITFGCLGLNKREKGQARLILDNHYRYRREGADIALTYQAANRYEALERDKWFLPSGPPPTAPTDDGLYPDN